MKTAIARWAYKRFAPLARRILENQPDFDLLLQKAGIRQRGDMYFAPRLALLLGLVIFTVLAGTMATLLHTQGIFKVPLPLAALGLTLALVIVASVYYWVLHGPRILAFMRGEEIDDNLPFAVNYMASMATSEVAPERLFQNLARQDVYGEIAVEAGLINRDVNVLGHDLITALSMAADRSPSARFEDFLDGAITAIMAGGALHSFLKAKADQYLEDRHQEQSSFLDSLGILAESYVTVAVAGPIFIIVLLSVLVLFGTSGDLTLQLGYVLMLLLVPLINAGFIVAVETVSPKV